jgi:WD40 repeat protein
LWDLANDRELGTVAGHLGSVTSVPVTPHGMQVVLASDDHRLKVWHAESGRVVATLTCEGTSECSAFADSSGWVRVLSIELDENN